MGSLTDLDDTTHAIKYGKHCEFFAQLNDFEATYPYWYKFELKACREILQGVHFNWNTYALEVTIIQRTQECIATWGEVGQYFVWQVLIL